MSALRGILVLHTMRSSRHCGLRFFDAGLSAGFRFGATVARVGKHDQEEAVGSG